MAKRKLAMNQAALDQKILMEQIKLLYQPLLPLLGVNLIVSIALVVALWHLISHALLLGWLTAMLAAQAYRWFIHQKYRRVFCTATVKQLAQYFVIGGGITGALWGCCALFLFPHDALAHQFVIIAILIGLGAGAVTTHNSYLPAFMAFFLPTLIPISIKLYTIDNVALIVMALLLTIYTLYMVYYGFVLHRSHEQSLRLRFENVDLVEQLRMQKEEAERANMAKSKFLAAASHDLRQPLHALTLFTSVLNDSNQTPENRKVVHQIDSSVQALESLFNALLDISRLDAGTMKVEKQNFRLQPIFERLRNDFAPHAEEKCIQFILPRCNDVVYSDPSLLEQILRNFVSNAVRYTQTGVVRIECERQNQQLLIKVIDSGLGIPAEERERIFGEFHQLNNPERDRSKGLGLGLAIVKRTASLLDHPIEVQSEQGKGSVFSIRVKLGRPEDVPANIEVVTKDTIHADSTALFVVIDDEESVRAGMQERLKLWGYEVIAAANLEGALDKLRQSKRRPDGIIADYRLRQNRTGIEAVRAIHAEFQGEIPALIITGDIAVEQLREVNDSGFQVLHKPVAPLKLRTFLRHAQRIGTDLSA
jgi:signal transduction histidine kinase/CheY-like chemotaxis protein